jgi:hypothetical protein
MRRLLFALLFCGAVTASATIVDRIAIVVGNKIVTDSEIDLRIRLTAFENGAPPDFSLTSRRIAAERLIDQKLVEREMDVGHYPRSDTDERAAAADEKSLAQYGLTRADLETDLARQNTLLGFLNLRFRPVVQDSGDADSALDAWLKDQRRRTRIEYLEKDLAP